MGPEGRKHLAEARHDLEECKKWIARTEPTLEEGLRALAGHAFDEMKNSKSFTEECLKHTDSKVRSVAIELMASHWKANGEFGPLCETLAVEDPDPDVRDAALVALGQVYAGTNHPRVGKLIADVICDESTSPQRRAMAYDSLCQLAGLGMEQWSSLSTITEGLATLDESQWSVVRRFLK